MAHPPIAVQLYSVRDAAGADLMGTLEQVKAMGYDGVEFAGYYGHAPEEIRKKLDELGLKAYGTHTPMSDLAPDKFDATVQLHKTLGTNFVIVPWIPKEKRDTAAHIEETNRELTELVDKLAAHGLKLGFHAHGDDMHPIEGGEGAYYRIARGTPNAFILQYDTSNGADGGADPVQPILDFPGRSASVHLKETDGKDIGEGRVPWTKVLEAAKDADVWVIEHEAGAGPDALDAIQRAITKLKALL